jgi:hypothetical protein
MCRWVCWPFNRSPSGKIQAVGRQKPGCSCQRAAYYDVIGDRHAFAVLYHQLGGEAELTNREQEEKAQADRPAMPALPYEDPDLPETWGDVGNASPQLAAAMADFFSSGAERDSFIA